MVDIRFRNGLQAIRHPKGVPRRRAPTTRRRRMQARRGCRLRWRSAGQVFRVVGVRNHRNGEVQVRDGGMGDQVEGGRARSWRSYKGWLGVWPASDGGLWICSTTAVEGNSLSSGGLLLGTALNSRYRSNSCCDMLYRYWCGTLCGPRTAECWSARRVYRRKARARADWGYQAIRLPISGVALQFRSQLHAAG